MWRSTEGRTAVALSILAFVAAISTTFVVRVAPRLTRDDVILLWALVIILLTVVFSCGHMLGWYEYHRIAREQEKKNRQQLEEERKRGAEWAESEYARGHSNGRWEAFKEVFEEHAATRERIPKESIH